MRRRSTNGKSNTISVTKVKVEDVEMEVCADTGCPQNLIGEHTFNKIQKLRLKKKKDGITLIKSNIVLRPYCTDKPIPIIGKFRAIIENEHKLTTDIAYVVQGDADNLLSRQTSEELEIVKIDKTQELTRRE